MADSLKELADAVERCAQVAERFPMRLDWPQTRIFEEIATAIRQQKDTRA